MRGFFFFVSTKKNSEIVAHAYSIVIKSLKKIYTHSWKNKFQLISLCLFCQSNGVDMGLVHSFYYVRYQ
jgi:hypothetical protein